MIKKPQGYDEAPVYTGESQQLPKGKYVCIIKQVATQVSQNGNEQFVILYDIAEGEYAGFYDKLFKADKTQNPSGAKWKGVFKQNMEGKGLSWFKGVITSIERSNQFRFNWDQADNEKTLAGKKFGAIMYREQFEGKDGSRPFATRIWQIRSLDGLKDAEVPEDKLLPERAGVYPDPAQASALAFTDGMPDSDGFVQIPEGANDEGIPFM